MRTNIASAAVLTLLSEREPGATICPSEVARKIAADASVDDKADWRVAMPIIHRAVDELLDQGTVSLSWKGSALSARVGPYRIALTTTRS